MDNGSTMTQPSFGISLTWLLCLRWISTCGVRKPRPSRFSQCLRGPAPLKLPPASVPSPEPPRLGGTGDGCWRAAPSPVPKSRSESSPSLATALCQEGLRPPAVPGPPLAWRGLGAVARLLGPVLPRRSVGGHVVVNTLNAVQRAQIFVRPSDCNPLHALGTNSIACVSVVPLPADGAGSTATATENGG